MVGQGEGSTHDLISRDACKFAINAEIAKLPINWAKQYVVLYF